MAEESYFNQNVVNPIQNAWTSLTKGEDLSGLPYEAQAAALAKRQKLAELLMQQGQQQPEVLTYKGIAAQPSVAGGLGKALSQFMGAYMGGKADEALTAAKAKESQKFTDTMKNFYELPDTSNKNDVAVTGALDLTTGKRGPNVGTIGTSGVYNRPTTGQEQTQSALNLMSGGGPYAGVGASLLSDARKRIDSETERQQKIDDAENERKRVINQESSLARPENVPAAQWNAALGVPGLRTKLVSENAVTKHTDFYNELVDGGLVPGSDDFVKAMAAKRRKETYIAPTSAPTQGAPKNYKITGPDGNSTQKFLYAGEAKAYADAGNQVSEALPTRRVPAQLIPTIGTNFTAIKKVDKAIDAVTQYPDAVGLKRAGPDWWNQRLDPKGTTVRALIADIGSLKLHDRSGAAVNASEAPRLMPFIPQIGDAPDVVVRKLRQFRSEYESIIADQSISYSDEEGYITPGILTAAQQYVTDRNERDALLAKKGK